MREITLSDIERGAAREAAEETFHMDEESFRGLYSRTARSLWSYLSRASDPAMADDLLQECYYRFLRSKLPEMNEAYQKNYLYRIATNLLRDHWRRRKPSVPLTPSEILVGERTAEDVERQSDLSRALWDLKPRERELLWLAYVEGSTHKEIADRLGLKTESVRMLLFRARRRLASLLRGRGWGLKSAEVPPRR